MAYDWLRDEGMATERIWVRVHYTVTKDAQTLSGAVEFVARVADAGRGANMVSRARKAVARRLHVPVSSVDITGLISG